MSSLKQCISALEVKDDLLPKKECCIIWIKYIIRVMKFKFMDRRNVKIVTENFRPLQLCISLGSKSYHLKFHFLTEIIKEGINFSLIIKYSKKCRSKSTKIFLEIALREKSAHKAIHDKDIKKISLTLHFYSAKAYRYVRKAWKNLLPAPSTLRSWYSRLHGEPGFCEESMNALRSKANSSSNKVICNLVMDEMDIRTELTFRNNKYHGYVEMGLGDLKSDTRPFAKKALVFMLVCLNGRWILPIGYFLIDSITRVELSQLVKTALELVDGCGVIVRSMTFDGASTNLTCCKRLGANLKTGVSILIMIKYEDETRKVVFFYYRTLVCFDKFASISSPSRILSKLDSERTQII